ncbi:MAG: hypothetical protein ABIJ21_06435 [Nanoarchaeota archaeon]
MSWKNIPFWLRGGIIGSAILALAYIIPLFFLPPDFIVFFRPYGMLFWLIQWISFLIGGWILAIIMTILFLVVIGFILGALVGFIVMKFLKK